MAPAFVVTIGVLRFAQDDKRLGERNEKIWLGAGFGVPGLRDARVGCACIDADSRCDVPR